MGYWLLAVPRTEALERRARSLDSAECERKRLYARIEKLDLELSIGYGARLPDQLIQPLFGHRAVALLINVEAVASPRGLFLYSSRSGSA
jgi:hypothetical protein